MPAGIATAANYKVKPGTAANLRRPAFSLALARAVWTVLNRGIKNGAGKPTFISALFCGSFPAAGHKVCVRLAFLVEG